MWPTLVYMTKEECLRGLRQLELDAYAMLVSALRAQGPLTPDKRKVLKELCKILNVGLDRHKCEVRRAVNDERLNTIAYTMHGPGISMEDWCYEGRRVMPVLQRIQPQTLHPVVCDQEMPAYERSKSQESYVENDKNAEMEDQSTVPKPPKVHRPTAEPEKSDKTHCAKKIINHSQRLKIVSSSETIPTSGILHKTLSVPISKVTKINLEKFKIVPSSFQVSNPIKQNFIASKTGKKLIPLSQLQMLNHKLNSKGGIKVLPISSKIFGKNITMTRITNPQQGLKTSTVLPLESSSGNKVESIDDKNVEETIHKETKEDTIKTDSATAKGGESKEIGEENAEKDQDDLISLMEIDSTEFIEPELKEPLVVRPGA